MSDGKKKSGSKDLSSLPPLLPPNLYSKTIVIKDGIGDNDIKHIEYPLELRNQDYLRRIFQFMRPAIHALYHAVTVDDAEYNGITVIEVINGIPITTMEYIKHLGKNQNHLEGYGEFLDKLPHFIQEHYNWMLDAIKLIEFGNLVADYDFLNNDDDNDAADDEEGKGEEDAVKGQKVDDNESNKNKDADDDNENQKKKTLKKDKISESKIRSALGNATAFVSVVGEKFDLNYVLDNLNTLRAQYNAHAQYKRERLDTLMSLDGKQTSRADRPTVNPDGSLTFHYKYDFDKNGILYYIGTEGLTTEYTNPTEGKRVIVKRSSDGSGLVENFVGRKGVYTSTDYREQSQPWFQVDLGQFRRIYPIKYTIRHGSAMGWLRMENWRLEGSMDGKRWFTLRRHTNEDKIPSNIGFASYTFDIEERMVRKTRYFRVTQTKPNEGQHDLGKGKFKHNTLFLSGFEVYGRLVEK